MSDSNAIVIQNSVPVHTNIVLGNQNFQFIYASQLYNTFFIVCARFLLDSNEEILQSIEIKLLNYKGLLNLGLLQSTKDNLKRDTKIIGGLNLTLDIQAMSGVHGHHNSIIIDNLNYPVDSLTDFMVTRKIHQFAPTTNIANHLNDMVFDEEFFQRDGTVIHQKDNHLDDIPVKENGKIVVLTHGKCKDTRAKFIVIPKQSS